MKRSTSSSANANNLVSFHDRFYFEGMTRILKVLNRIQDLEELIQKFVEEALAVFDCDRVFLLYPLDPEAATFSIPVEACKPEFPGALEVGLDLPVTDEQKALFRALLGGKDVISLNREDLLPVGEETPAFKEQQILLPQSAVITALYPRVEKPWAFGLHQCAYERQWTDSEVALFQDIAVRLSETLSNRLLLRELVRSNSELRQAEADTKNARETAERANAAKSAFLANMSHELRTPLNSIIGFSEMMHQQTLGAMPPAYMEYAELIVSSGKHLLEVINQVLDLSKIEAQKMELSLAEVALGTLIGDVVVLLTPQASRKNVHLHNITDCPHTLHVDPLRIRQVLFNVIGNAVKFTHTGEIAITSQCDDGAHHIIVSDTGQGMTEDEIVRALEPFQQAQVQDDMYVRRSEGTGLGLTLAQRLMELHGGSIDLRSTPGKGTTVTLSFPASFSGACASTDVGLTA